MRINDIDSALQAQALTGRTNLEDKRIGDFEAAIKRAAQSNDVTELKKVASDFEEIFLNMMLKAMRQTVGDAGLIEKSNQTQIFESMLDEKFAEKLADAGGLGIGDLIVEQMKAYAAQQGEQGESKIDIKG